MGGWLGAGKGDNATNYSFIYSASDIFLIPLPLILLLVLLSMWNDCLSARTLFYPPHLIDVDTGVEHGQTSAE